MVWDNFESALPQFNIASDQDSPYTEGERDLLSELFRDLTVGAAKAVCSSPAAPAKPAFPELCPTS